MNRIWILAAAATVGCYGERQPECAALGLVEVSGKVTMDGAPLPNAQVAFENPEDKTYSVGKTDAAGAYRLMFNSDKSGCTPGRKIVRISPFTGSESDPDAETSDAVIPARYNRRSELVAEVDAANRSFDFDLKSQ